MTNETIEQAIRALQAGKMVIVADDDDREAEGDFIMAASLIQDQDVNLMASRGRGLICCALSPEIAGHLDLQVQGGALHQTAFTDSVDYCHGTTTGISCADRALGLRALADPVSRPADFARPGHLFPLVARPKGVLERRGHTEAAVDLCLLAGLPAAGVICEIMNPDGTMARRPQLQSLAQELDMVFLTVEELANYRRQLTDQIPCASATPPAATVPPGLRIGVQARLPTPWGEFTITTLRHEPEAAGLVAQAPIVLSIGLDRPVPADAPLPLVRIHSACVTGELFGSLRCDCGPQLDRALELIGQAGRGALVYLHQEGRGIGLEAKLTSYGLQDQGLDTFDANLALGFPADGRDYRQAAQALQLFGLHDIRLLTNNPDKVDGLRQAGIRVSERLALSIPANPHNQDYLETKRSRFGHHLAEIVKS